MTKLSFFKGIKLKYSALLGQNSGCSQVAVGSRPVHTVHCRNIRHSSIILTIFNIVFHLSLYTKVAEVFESPDWASTPFPLFNRLSFFTTWTSKGPLLPLAPACKVVSCSSTQSSDGFAACQDRGPLVQMQAWWLPTSSSVLTLPPWWCRDNYTSFLSSKSLRTSKFYENFLQV